MQSKEAETKSTTFHFVNGCTAWLVGRPSLALMLPGCPAYVCLSTWSSWAACKWHTLHMKLEIIFQFTNETFHTQLQIRGNFKVCDCRNRTPWRAVVNRLEGQGSKREGVQYRFHIACWPAQLQSSFAMCSASRSTPLPSDNCAAAAAAAPCVFLGTFRHFWLLFFGEANSRRKLQTKVNAKSGDRAAVSPRKLLTQDQRRALSVSVISCAKSAHRQHTLRTPTAPYIPTLLSATWRATAHYKWIIYARVHLQMDRVGADDGDGNGAGTGAARSANRTKYCGRRQQRGPGQCQMSCGSVSLVP